jgi:hypothetical protein
VPEEAAPGHYDLALINAAAVPFLIHATTTAPFISCIIPTCMLPANPSGQSQTTTSFLQASASLLLLHLASCKISTWHCHDLPARYQ